MKERGFYIISNNFFEDFPDPYLLGNKGEARPHYYAFKDNKTGLYWMIPMSSQIEKYKGIINNFKTHGKICNTLHIAKLGNDKESVFLIRSIFPITEKYILREYTIGGIPFTLKDDITYKAINKKCRAVLSMLRQGKKFVKNQPDVLLIEKNLLKSK